MVLVELIMMYPGVLNYEPKDKEVRAFSTKKQAEQWLMNNGFCYGRRFNYMYEGSEGEWLHKNETYWHYIEVRFHTYELDDISDSKFKNYKIETPKWFYDKGE